MRNIDAWLDRKYSVQEMNARSASQEAGARSGLLEAQTGQLPADSAAQRAAQYGQAAAGRGAGAQSQAVAQQTPGLAGAEIAQRYGAASQANAEADSTRSLLAPASQSYTDAVTRRFGAGFAPTNPFMQGGRITDTNVNPIATGVQPGGQGLQAIPANYPPVQQIGQPPIPDNYNRGTEKVPGKGDGTVDTQPAMLAPGEAVLNKAAAEHLGRHTIELLNALGEAKMNLNPGPEKPKDLQSGNEPAYAGGTSSVPHGYAKGTTKVPGKAIPAKGPAKAQGKAPAAKSVQNGTKPQAPAGQAPALPPRLLAALLQMGNVGGAGMPPPGGAQPMPMPMPMSGGQG